MNVGKHHLFPVVSLVYGFSAVRITKESVKPYSSQQELSVGEQTSEQASEQAVEAAESEASLPSQKEKITCDDIESIEEIELPAEDIRDSNGNSNQQEKEILEEKEEKEEKDKKETVEEMREVDFISECPSECTEVDPPGFPRQPTDLELYQSSEAVDSASVTEAKPTMYTYQRPVLQDKISNLSSMSYASYTVPDVIEEEPPDLDYANVSDLSEEDAEIVKFMHGWDFTKRGSLLQPYPNCPTICVPAPSLNGKVQVSVPS